GTRRRCAGTVQEPGLALGAVAGDPLRQGRPSDAELGSDVGDRASANDHLSDSSLPSKSGERGITAGHGKGLLPAAGCLDTTHRAGQGPVPSSPHRDYTVMTRNSQTRGGHPTDRGATDGAESARERRPSNLIRLAPA